MDYFSKSERKAWEKKWNILQRICEVFNSASQSKKISIPQSRLETELKLDPVECNEILKGLSIKERCFRYTKEKGYYEFFINEKSLSKSFKNTQTTYDKYAEKYRMKVQIEKNGIEYTFKPKQKQGSLILSEKLKLTFSKIPALIVNFFYANKKNQNEYKTYTDFNESPLEYPIKVDSDEFNKKIKQINHRVNKKTDNSIKELIYKNRLRNSKDACSYIWNEHIG